MTWKDDGENKAIWQIEQRSANKMDRFVPIVCCPSDNECQGEQKAEDAATKRQTDMTYEDARRQSGAAQEDAEDGDE